MAGYHHTGLITAYRPSTIREVDKLLVPHDGSRHLQGAK